MQIVIDDDRFLAALARCPDTVTRKMRIAVGQGLSDIQAEARASHRYKYQGGMAEMATGGAGPDISSTGLSGYLQLQRGIAPYVRRLHVGWGSWAPDPFLYNAAKLKKAAVLEGMRQAVSDAIKEAGL